MNVLLSVLGGLCVVGLGLEFFTRWLWHDDPAAHARRDAEGR